MTLFGITGGVGMGKSTAAGILQKLGVAVIDTDQIARDIVQPGQPALDEIKREFGHRVINEKGELLRKELAAEVFRDPVKRAKLESILHPRIRAVWFDVVQQWRAENKSAAAVIIPLLFETNAQSAFTATVCLACSQQTQVERLRQRGWSDDELQKRIAAQWPVEKKIAQSDFVVWTDTTVEAHADQLRLVLHC
ncbi:MAG: dephospho-CoA kinase [Limisphaerales bacterium]